jgi:superfamily II DNA or RNA helicase
MIELINPAQILLKGYTFEDLKKKYTYTNKSVHHQIQRLKNNPYFVNKFGEEAWREELARLREKLNPCLLEETDAGILTYSGFIKDFPDEFKAHYSYPDAKGLVWYSDPPFKAYKYQLEAVERLLKARHGAISLPTGTGKSFCILLLVKELGLKTVIMAPSVSIASQLNEVFVKYLGQKYVGFIGNGKRKTDKLITIGLAQSLTKIHPGTKEWDDLSKAQVYICDESHLVAAETFKEVCLGICKNAPYRFFVSATQMRGDGSDLLLNGITGPIVMNISFKDAVDNGYISKPNFIIVKSESNTDFESNNVLRMLEKHLYSNSIVHKQAAELANQSVELLDQSVLIMIDHVKQFPYLMRFLKHDVRFAHGGITAQNKKYIDARYHKSDPHDLVKKFNNGDFKILVSTSCLSVGSDFKSVNSIINLQGGRSEVKFTQLIGRGTRITDSKKNFNFIDFDISNNSLLHFHTLERIKIYKSLYNNVKYI